jgi:tRNA-intron endonuclease
MGMTKRKKAISKKKPEKAKAAPKEKSFKAILAGGRVFSNAQDAFTLYEQSRFGEPTEGKIYYSLAEALYLIEKGKLQVYSGKKKLSFNSFLLQAQKDEENFHTRFVVFRDMRNRGYIVKTALKFGADFRIYERGIKPGEDHAKWILYPVYESNSLTWQEFAAKNRVAHSTRKKLLIGIVDDENDVTYYEIEWKKP